MSPARLGAFAQRIASTIVQREVAIAHDGDNFRTMKVLVLIVSACGFWLLTSAIAFFTLFHQLVLGTQAKKPLHLTLSELDRENAARFAFEYFARVRLPPFYLIRLFHSAFRA
jgi:hypothetical protein